MKKKILTFVVNRGKFLALHSEPHPDHGKGGWFVVTGGVEENETHEEAVAREILEETGLAVDEIIPLNWGSIYNWWDELCEELNFISFVKSGEMILNEEHSKFDWLEIDEFIERIKWDDDKELLKTILEKALNKEKHFHKMTVKDYRK
ncbi:MAG: NUDIX domain-containing protein [Candidatus Pacearchaeota archaeon]